MKTCPKCGSALSPKRRHGIEVDYCPACQGMWLDRSELADLENKRFDFDEDVKGTLVTNVAETAHKCPVCEASLKQFSYRFYDLKVEICEQHGFWLDRDEDKRILELMKKEDKETTRSVLAEERWDATLRRMRSPSFFDKLRNLFD